MKKRFLILLFTAVFCNACQKDGNCFRKGGHHITELRDTQSFFQAIRICDVANLEFETGAANRIECDGPRDLLDLLGTEVDTNVLNIRNQNKCRWLGKYDESFRVKAKMPNIYNLEILGNNRVSNTDTIRSDYFRIYLENASGSLDLQVANEYLVFSEYSGICRSSLRGYTQKFEAACAGNATKHFEALRSVKSIITNAGGTDIYLGKCDTLEAEIRHTGNIYYTGNPVITKYIRLSSGKLVKH